MTTDSEPTDDEPREKHPATWENVVAGKAKELIGRLTGDKAYVAEGEEQADIAQEIREDEHAGTDPNSDRRLFPDDPQES